MKSEKLNRLKKILSGMQRVVVAFSGGVDSTLLLKIALDTIGKENVLAVTARSEAFPAREYDRAKKTAKDLSAPFLAIATRETSNEDFIRNPVDRCYYCKRELFGRLTDIARKRGFRAVVDGANYDDRRDLRYGSRAAGELGVRSPLDEARIGKEDIRRFSKALQLPTWDKPSFACLASRFPYQQRITKAKLKMVDRAELLLADKGFTQVRVRAHKNVARIEVSCGEMNRITAGQQLRNDILHSLKKLGFAYVTLDLGGYRSGSMNEVLRKNRRGSSRRTK